MESQGEQPHNHYETLGVPPDADADAIRQAYQRLASQYHPDRNHGDKSAERKFKAMTEAYNILSDPEKKADYDRSTSQQGGTDGGDKARQNAGDKSKADDDNMRKKEPDQGDEEQLIDEIDKLNDEIGKLKILSEKIVRLADEKKLIDKEYKEFCSNLSLDDEFSNLKNAKGTSKDQMENEKKELKEALKKCVKKINRFLDLPGKYKGVYEGMQGHLKDRSGDKIKKMAKDARHRAKVWWANRAGVEVHQNFVIAHWGEDSDQLKIEKDEKSKPTESTNRLPSFARSGADFFGLLLLFFLFEGMVNSGLYAQAMEGGLSEGLIVAFGIGFFIIFLGCVCGYSASFLKGYETNDSPKQSMSKSSDNTNDPAPVSKWVKWGLLNLVFVISAAFFYYYGPTLREEHGLPGVMFVLALIFSFLFLIYRFLFGKNNAYRERRGYFSRPFYKLLGYGTISLSCLFLGIGLVMVACLYREEIKDLSESVKASDNAARIAMKHVWERFASLNFLPGEGVDSIILALVNFAGFIVSVYKGYWKNGPYQNYRKSRLAYEEEGTKYNEHIIKIEKAENNALARLNGDKDDPGFTGDALQTFYKEGQSLCKSIQDGRLVHLWDTALEMAKKPEGVMPPMKKMDEATLGFELDNSDNIPRP